MSAGKRSKSLFDRPWPYVHFSTFLHFAFATHKIVAPRYLTCQGRQQRHSDVKAMLNQIAK